MKLRKLVGGAVLVLASLVVSVAIAEAAVRMLDLAPSSGVFTVDAREFQSVPGIFAPDRTTLDRRIPALPHTVSINALGYRGASFPRDKPSGEFRILFLGDSFIYGDYVDDHETLPARLDSAIAGQCVNVRVVNAGIGGASIPEALAMSRRGIAIDPDLVIVGFSENDVTDLQVRSLWDDLEYNRQVKSLFPMRLLYPVVRETALWNLLLRARGKVLSRRAASIMAADPPPAVPSDVIDETPPGLDDPERRRRYEEVFLRLVSEVREAGAEVAFVSFPSHLTLRGTWNDEQIRWVHSIARQAGVPDVNLIPALREHGGSETEIFLLPHDGHPSALGYAIGAAALAPRLLELPVLARHCGRAITPAAATP